MGHRRMGETGNYTMSEIHAFSKGIKSNRVSYDKIANPVNVSKILEVVSKLEQLSNVSTAKIAELKLDSNPATWITFLLKDYPKKVRKLDFEYLLSNFTDKFKTRMREDTKYAIGLLAENGLLLCHSIYGEETITPDWSTIPRMLDTGNVLRYVHFYYVRGMIEVKYWEKTASASFIEWLGLSRKQALKFGGAYSVGTEIDNMNARFELTEEDMEKLVNNHPEFLQGKIELQSAIRLLRVNNVRIGNKTFEKVGEFVQWYEAENLGIPLYKKKYDALKEDMSPLWFRYFDTKTGLLRYEGDEIITAISKDLPDLDVLFSDDSIKFDEAYVEDFAKRLLNDEIIKVHHVALPFFSPPIIIAKVRIYNRLQLSAAIERLIGYYNQADFQDVIISLCVKYIIFAVLGELNKDLPIAHFFKKVAASVAKSIRMEGLITESEGQIIEYKSRDIWVGDTKKISTTLANDIEVKLRHSPFKAYFIGVEDDGRISPISRSRLKNDRANDVKTELEKRLQATVHVLPVISEDDGIVLLAVYRTSEIK
ncbi:hypothetical protein ACFLTR_00240 [Chloroflexota bacterium]